MTVQFQPQTISQVTILVSVSMLERFSFVFFAMLSRTQQILEEIG